MSNVNADRRVEGDWWADPIPSNVDFGEGFRDVELRRIEITNVNVVRLVGEDKWVLVIEGRLAPVFTAAIAASMSA